MAAVNPDGRPLPRLSHLVKKSPDDEFGFNLHAEKGRGHFIGKVDSGGIGDKAGLVMGQRIVGVNGELIFPSTPHKVRFAYKWILKEYSGDDKWNFCVVSFRWIGDGDRKIREIRENSGFRSLWKAILSNRLSI